MNRSVVVGLCGLIASGASLPSLAQDPCRPITGSFQWGVGVVRLIGTGVGRSADVSALNGAGAMWNACGGVPDFTTFASGDDEIQVVFYAGANDGRVVNCGTECGCRSGDTIHIFSTNTSGLRDCTSTWPNLIAHELGHYLGLGNAGTGCGCVIMGNTACGPTVVPDDCAATNDLWMTPSEEPEPPYNDPIDSPLLVDLDHNGFHLTDNAGGVLFDLRPGGELEHLSWTARDSGDGFLALDANSNGRIDDGSELFGNYSRQPPSDDPNGFFALAVYDDRALGGNEDDSITSADAIFDLLRVWVDADHDGQSSPQEMTTLGENGIHSLPLRYIESRRRDRHGNEFRYLGFAYRIRGHLQVMDVFLIE